MKRLHHVFDSIRELERRDWVEAIFGVTYDDTFPCRPYVESDGDTIQERRDLDDEVGVDLRFEDVDLCTTRRVTHDFVVEKV